MRRECERERERGKATERRQQGKEEKESVLEKELHGLGFALWDI